MAWENPKTNWGQPGQTVPGVDDFNRIEGNIETLGRYDRAPGYGTATGTNAKTITLDPAPTSYYDGLCFAFKNSVENTGAVTINVNGLGAKAVKKPNGNDVAAGNLKAGSIYTVRYNGTNFILQGSDSSGNATPEHVLAGKTFSNDNDTGITGTMPNRGAINEIITVQGGQIIIPEGYHNGNGIVKANFANLIAGNVKSGVNIGGITGTYHALAGTGSSDLRVYLNVPHIHTCPTRSMPDAYENYMLTKIVIPTAFPQNLTMTLYLTVRIKRTVTREPAQSSLTTKRRNATKGTDWVTRSLIISNGELQEDFSQQITFSDVQGGDILEIKHKWNHNDVYYEAETYTFSIINYYYFPLYANIKISDYNPSVSST